MESLANLSSDEYNHVNSTISIFSGIKIIIRIAIPIVISFSLSFILLAIAIFSGHLNHDTEHAGATTLTTTLINAIGAIIFGPFLAVGLIISSLYGEWKVSSLSKNQTLSQNKIDEIAGFNKNSLILSISVSIIPVLIFIYSGSLFRKLGQDQKVSNIAQEFLRFFSIAMPGWGWQMINEQLLLATRKEGALAAIAFTSFLFTSVLAYLFGFGRLHFPKMGLKGIALGFIIESYLTPLLIVGYIFFQKELKSLQLFKFRSSNSSSNLYQIKEILKQASPIFLSFSNELGTQLVINNFMGLLGKNELAAQDVLTQFYFLMNVLNVSLAQATSQEFGRSLGMKQYQHAHIYAISGLLNSGFILSLFSLSISIYPKWMTYLLFNQNHTNHSWFPLLKKLAPINAIGIVFDALGFNMIQVLRSGGDNFISSLISITTLWLGVLLGGLLGFKTNLKAQGLLIGYTVGLFLRAFFLGIRWKIMINTKNLQAIKEDKDNFFNQSCCRSLFFKSKPSLEKLLLESKENLPSEIPKNS